MVTNPALNADELFGQVRANWGWLLALGVLFLLLGTLGLGRVTALTVGSVMFFGVLAIIGGAAQLAQVFKCSGWKAVLVHVLIGALYVAAGLEMLTNPIGASVVLTLFLGATIGAIGLLRIVFAFQHRGTTGWVWTLLGGIVTVVLSFMILSSWPVSGLWIIGLFVSVELIVNGWSTIFLALAARNATASQA
jgi:uncharacterized membrane protein HdeD (DUF308 family)